MSLWSTRSLNLKFKRRCTMLKIPKSRNWWFGVLDIQLLFSLRLNCEISFKQSCVPARQYPLSRAPSSTQWLTALRKIFYNTPPVQSSVFTLIYSFWLQMLLIKMLDRRIKPHNFQFEWLDHPGSCLLSKFRDLTCPPQIWPLWFNVSCHKTTSVCFISP